ncbi:hypothetical protein ADK57_12365 [Streptomyces sp. MMG1533]|nr:hypothetical protein ADK57_12365 [Streptomyces sp. MMG1533]
MIRGRPRRARSHISVRVTHAVLGGAAGLVWLVLPGMTISTDVPVAISTDAPVAAAAPEDEGSSATDLVLPLVVVGAVGALAGYGYLRRTRRARTRTTPGGTHTTPAAPPLTELDDRSRTLLTDADNWIRTSREELSYAEARSGPTAVAPFTLAVRDAESELSAAFRIRQRYDTGVPDDETSRRHALAGIAGRCQEAGRRLDEEAAAFDRLRALEREIGEALAVAETRFRELAGRTSTTESTLADLAERYAPAATASVTGSAEQAKDRLVFATTHLNQAHQMADLGDAEVAARHLRAAEGAVDQAAAFVDGIDRLATELRFAAGMVASALTGAEAELSGVRGMLPAAGEGKRPADAGMGAMTGALPEAGAGTRTGAGDTADDARRSARRPESPDALPRVPVGELRSRVLHADSVLASVRQELTGGQPYDPLGVLHRIVRALAPVATGRAGVLPAAARLAAHSATAVADTFVATHRGVVGAHARTRLAAARELLDAPLAGLVRAHSLAGQARELAEQDVRVHGNPVTGAAGHASGVAGAVLGGILLGGGPDGGPPPSFGGPHTEARRGLPSA